MVYILSLRRKPEISNGSWHPETRSAHLPHRSPVGSGVSNSGADENIQLTYIPARPLGGGDISDRITYRVTRQCGHPGVRPRGSSAVLPPGRLAERSPAYSGTLEVGAGCGSGFFGTASQDGAGGDGKKQTEEKPDKMINFNSNFIIQSEL